MTSNSIPQKESVIRQLCLHDHGGLLFTSSEEKIDALLPMVKEGLQARQKCVYLADPPPSEEFLKAIRSSGIELGTGGLTVITKEAVFGDERFSCEKTLALLRSLIDDALDQGFIGLRFFGDSTVLPDDPAWGDVVFEYEQKVNRLAQAHPIVLVCLYDLTLSSPETILTVFHAHPLIVHEGLVCDNPYYIPPEELSGSTCAKVQVERMLRNVKRRAQVEQKLRRSEELFHHAANHFPGSFVIYDPDLRFKYVNPFAQTYTGISQELFIGRRDDELFPPEVTTVYLPALRGAARSRLPQSVDILWNYHTGPALLSLEFIPILNKEGELQEILGVSRDITKHKRTENELRKREVELEEAQNLASLGHWELDPATYRITGSDECWVIVGLPSVPQGYPLSEIMELIHPNDRPFVQTAIDEALVGTKPYNLEFRFVLPTNVVRFVHVRGRLHADENGRSARLFGMIQDITDRKMAEAALRQSDETFRQLTTNLTDVFWLSSSDMGRFYYVSPAYETIWGRTRQSLYEDAGSWLESVFPEDRAKAKAAAERTRIEPINTEYRLRRPDGSERWVQVRTFHVRDEAGSIIRVAGICTDITESKAAEAAIRRRETLLQEAQSLAHLGSWEWDLLDDTVTWSDEVYRICGLDAQTCTPTTQNSLEIIHPDDRERVAANMARLREHESSMDMEFRIVRPDGAVRYSHSRGRSIRGEDGKLVRFAGMVHDITEIRDAHEALKRANEQLRVLSQRVFKVQEEERERVAREIHDEFGQTLTFANLQLQTLRAAKDPNELSRGIDDAIGLLDQLLQQAKRLSLDLHPPVLDDLGLAAALRWYFDHQSQRVGFEVEFSIEPGLPRVDRGIETACFRIAQEALTNVLRHACANSVFVELLRVSHDLRLAVRDDGSGFDVNAAMERAQHGASLGLVGMRERATLVGGRLDVISSPGRGTDIVASFPLTPSSQHAEIPA